MIQAKKQKPFLCKGGVSMPNRRALLFASTVIIGGLAPTSSRSNFAAGAAVLNRRFLIAFARNPRSFVQMVWRVYNTIDNLQSLAETANLILEVYGEISGGGPGYPSGDSIVVDGRFYQYVSSQYRGGPGSTSALQYNVEGLARIQQMVSSESDIPTQNPGQYPRGTYTCVTQWGACAVSRPMLPGTPCACSDGRGYNLPGTAR